MADPMAIDQGNRLPLEDIDPDTDLRFQTPPQGNASALARLAGLPSPVYPGGLGIANSPPPAPLPIAGGPASLGPMGLTLVGHHNIGTPPGIPVFSGQNALAPGTALVAQRMTAPDGQRVERVEIMPNPQATFGQSQPQQDQFRQALASQHEDYCRRVAWLENRNIACREEARAELREYTSGLAGAASRFEIQTRQVTQAEFLQAEGRIEANYEEVQQRTQEAARAIMDAERVRLVEEAEELLYVQRGNFLAEYQRALGDQQSQMTAQQQQTYAAASNAVSSAEMQTNQFQQELSQEQQTTLRLQVELREALDRQHAMSEQME